MIQLQAANLYILALKMILPFVSIPLSNLPPQQPHFQHNPAELRTVRMAVSICTLIQTLQHMLVEVAGSLTFSNMVVVEKVIISFLSKYANVGINMSNNILQEFPTV